MVVVHVQGDHSFTVSETVEEVEQLRRSTGGLIELTPLPTGPFKTIKVVAPAIVAITELRPAS